MNLYELGIKAIAIICICCSTCSEAIQCYDGRNLVIGGLAQDEPRLPPDAVLADNCDYCTRTKGMRVRANLTAIVYEWRCVRAANEVESTTTSTTKTSSRKTTTKSSTTKRLPVRSGTKRSWLLPAVVTSSTAEAVTTPKRPSFFEVRTLPPTTTATSITTTNSAQYYEDDDRGNLQTFAEQDDQPQSAGLKMQPSIYKNCIENLEFSQIPRPDYDDFVMQTCSCCLSKCNNFSKCGIVWLTLFESFAFRKK